jgi:hypothetical protein
MEKRRGFIQARLLSGQSGQALILVLIFLLLGSLTLVPALAHVSTALKTGVKYEEKTNALYAADAGVEDAIWQIKYNGLEARFGDANYNYIFSANASYSLDSTVNRLTTNITIANVWAPSNVTLDDLLLTPAQAKEIIERPVTDNTTNRLILSGTPTDEDDYRIKIDFYPAVGVTENLSVSSIGIWLPHGFTYNGGCNMASFAGTHDKYEETTEARPGGTAVVWDFSLDPIYFTDLPPEDLETTDNPQTAEITFKYTNTGGNPASRPNAIAWIVTAGPISNYAYATGGGVPIAWDIDTRFYKITSVAGDTKIEAYASRCEMRNMYAATPGDYVAIGNSLMTDDNLDPENLRETWHSSSDATLSSLPDDAYISQAYLYWSGFFKSGFSAAFWGPDTCGNWDNWDMSKQTRVPTGDGLTSGTWTTSPYWDDVDETTANDADYITGVSLNGSNAYQLFTFSSFSVPAGATIQDLTVYFRARDASSGGNNIRASIKVNGSNYYNGSSNDPGAGWTTYSYSYTTNPNNGSTWTVADINGTGTRPLQQFGVYSNDLDPDLQVSMVYAEVNYSCWGISSGQFRGRFITGSNAEADRYLTMKSSVDLSSHAAGQTIVEWEQSESGTLEGAADPANRDSLQFQISSDNGATWSELITAFCDDLNSTYQYYYYVIPESYLTTQFKMRFYLDGFSGSGEYCSVDTIGIATITGAADTTADFTVNGYDSHTETVNALVSQLIGNKYKGQYSYACRQDVTELVRAHSERNSANEPIGNAVYTVGNVLADESDAAGGPYYLAYCGWSLVVIYHSSDTAGRQLYLWNTFSYSKGGENLDFDGDGVPGGTITGFIVPERIGSEVEAAKLTCFVGEGDNCYTGDTIKFNGTLLNDGYGTNNVWNSKSLNVVANGIDIDTFSITWASGLLHADDTQAQIDLYTETDNFNLIYIILSVRSVTTIGGTEHYIISRS